MLVHDLVGDWTCDMKSWNEIIVWTCDFMLILSHGNHDKISNSPKIMVNKISN